VPFCFNGGAKEDRLDQFYLSVFLWKNSSSVTRLQFFRCALHMQACSKATIARRPKTTFRGCFCSSGVPLK
jgi:hypothetical protein